MEEPTKGFILISVGAVDAFPTEQSELTAWWVSEVGINPKPKYVKKKPSPGVNAPDGDDDEVMVDGEENQDGRQRLG